ncbi:MAG TPA: EAL domain-containing protein [Candidatus Dormibacteraeota bacterium]|nr:EAL domain-containing protein [Candidatus Dormibacteraeota bacterium]
MSSLSLGTARQTTMTMKDGDECVLLIEAQAGDAARILDELRSATDEPFRVEWVTELSSGIERLRNGGVGAVMLDLTLPDSHGVETFDKLFQAAPDVPILILSGADAEETARQAVQRGAQDYLVKNQADGYRLRRTVRTMMDHRAAEAMLLESEIANLTLDSIVEAVLRTDIRGNVTYLNRIAEKMTGWRREEALGRPVADVLRIIDRVSGAPVDKIVEIVMHEDKSERPTASSINCILVRRDGFEFGIENTVALIHDQDGAVTGAVVAFHDVSVARAKSLEMSHLAQHDSLTNLPNRILFNDRLTQAISLAERQGKQLAVMFVDLDHFKKINDSLGHGVGDKLLQSVAGRLVSCVRRADTISRLGGDEFVVLLSQVEHAEDAAVSARKILRTLAASHIIDNLSLDINVSIGVSTFPSDGRDAESLMDKADTAMYEAKQHGRNTYKFFRRDMHARAEERQSLERDLRYALGRNEFLLHYQPKINLQTGQITGVEALIRWVHPQRGMVYPAQFVPIAEECGLILPIGRWVLLEACKQARAWRDAGLGVVPMAVNVSAAEFGAKDFLSGVRAVLIATGVEPQNLELELTESVLMQDAESTVVTLGALKAMGVQLAIDDFGTGYSSFTYLRRFPADALKLHQSFVQEITADPGDAAIVSAMISIGKSLKQRVIAEGVETGAQLNFLQRHGCGEGQGYYFSRPVVAEQAGKLLDAGIREGVVH